MFEPVGTVDHYEDCKGNPHLAYEWTNYRFAAQWINSSKQSRRPGALQVLDPFEVEDGWFEILLPSLQLVVSNRVPRELRERAEYTLQKLHLRDDERVLRQRKGWYTMYLEKDDLCLLRKFAPLIARAVEKQAAQAG